MKNPKISVVMSCYNHERYVTEAIESIQMQSYQNWELILVDDCSTDSSVHVARKIAKKDSRIRILRHSYNQGTSRTLNDGIAFSSGEYIALQSADDVSLNHRLEKQITYFLEYPHTASVSSYVLPINDKNEVTEETRQYQDIFCRENTSRANVLHDFFIASNFINNSSQMIPSHIIHQVGRNRESLFQLHDYEYNIRLALIGDIHIIPEVLLHYRVRDDGANISLCNTKGMHCRQFIENYMVLDNYLEIKDVDFFMEIFGKYVKRMGVVREETIPYFLAMIAIQHCQEVPKKLWGFRILYSFCSQEGAFEVLRKDCGFTYTQFTQLVKRVRQYFS